MCFSMIQCRPKFFVVCLYLEINTQFSGTVVPSNDPSPAQTNILLGRKHITPRFGHLFHDSNGGRTNLYKQDN